MNYLVTDFECTCTDKEEFPREQMEIIEVGAVLINDKFEIIDEYERFVRPTINPILTDFCKTLTTIKQEWVDQADIFENVIVDFHDWVNEKGEFTFTSWGGFDFRHIERESKLKNVSNPFLCDFINYKVRFAKLKQLKRRNGVGVRKALNILNMDFEGTPHRGIDDARNVVNIIKKAGM